MAAAKNQARKSREVQYVPQLTETDCGAACLSAVLAYHGKHTALHTVRSRLGGGRNGANAKQLLTVARGFDLVARAVSVTPEKLHLLPPGSIMHWNLNHYVVFEGLDKKHCTIMDPAAGRRQIAWPEVDKALSGVALIFEPGPDFKRQRPERRARLRRYAGWMFGVRNVWSRVATTSFFLQVLALASPGLMALLVDKVVPRGDVPLLHLVAAGILILATFQFLSTLLRARLLLELRTRVETRMSFHFIDHLLALPYSFFQERTTGDLMMRMSSQAAIRELLTTGALSALLDGAFVSLYFVLLVSAAPSLAWVAVGFAAAQVLVYLVGRRRNSELVVEGLAAQAQLEGTQVEILSGIETLKAMGATDRAITRWTDLYVATLNRSIEKGRLDGTFQAFLGLLRFGGPVCLMLVGAQQVLDGGLSLGAMLGLAALGAGFLTPVANLVETALKLTQLHGYMERIEDVLETPRERRNLHASEEGQVALQGAIGVRELTFKYPSEVEPAVSEVSFHVSPGEMVAIVGASGSGKSTLARLLAGLYEAQAGAVTYDGRDLRGWDLTQLRTRLGIVTQDTRLFSGTIRDNVSLFDHGLSLSAIQDACRIACLDETIEQLPMGYDTVLADGGSSLSGGQRQRLSLARALVLSPSVLILDEATSALDAVTERHVQQNLRELSCTQVIVAHRLSTVVDADRILVMEAGRIVGEGTHAALLRTCPTYQSLVSSQGASLPLGLPGAHEPTQTPSGLRPGPYPQLEAVFERPRDRASRAITLRDGAASVAEVATLTRTAPASTPAPPPPAGRVPKGSWVPPLHPPPPREVVVRRIHSVVPGPFRGEVHEAEHV